MSSLYIFNNEIYTLVDIFYYFIWLVAIFFIIIGLKKHIIILLVGFNIAILQNIYIPFYIKEANYNYFKKMELVDKKGIIKKDKIKYLIKKGYIFTKRGIIDKNGNIVDINNII